MSNLLHIIRPYQFFKGVNESVKSAREFFVARKKEELLPEYKQKLIRDLRNDPELSQEEIAAKLSELESGVADREIRSKLLADKEVDVEILSDENFNRLMEKVKENTVFGPNILAFPIAKMYIRYSSDDDAASLLDLIASLNDAKLKNFLRGRNIDLGELLKEYAEKPEQQGVKTYDLFSDYIRSINTDIRANWLVQELKTDAAMGPQRNRPPFNQVEAYRKLKDGDPLKERFIRYANELEKRKNEPNVAAAINLIKKSIAAYGSLEDLVSFVGGQLDAALNSPKEMQDFLRQIQVAGPTVDLIYASDTQAVLVVHHEVALAMLFPMAGWCILPRGWGGGRNMWKSYVGFPEAKTIQFAIMDFSKPFQNNMRCWAFTYSITNDRITHVHAKDDANIINNFNQSGFNDIFSEKESITNSNGVTYENSNTFTVPKYAIDQLKDGLDTMFEKTLKYEETYKLRNKNGTEITDFTKSSVFDTDGVMRRFIRHGLVRASAKAAGRPAPAFISNEQNKDALDMILMYLAASPLSDEYKLSKERKQPTLIDTFISPFIKPLNSSLTFPFSIDNAELATYIIAILKSTREFREDLVLSFLKTLITFVKVINNTYSARSAGADLTKKYYYQIEEALDAIKVLLKSIDIKEISVGSQNKKITDLSVDDIKEVIAFIESITK
jgi:hypothetical protein